jgi:ethanolamine utilization protein EutQ
MTAPSVFRIADIQDRIDNLPENGTYIKPFVTTAISESMAGGINCLNKISVPWDLTCDEMIYCLQGTFRLVVDEIGYELNPGDLMFVPKDNHVKYECDDKCVIFYTAYPVDWKQRAGITHVPGIDADEMPAPSSATALSASVLPRTAFVTMTPTPGAFHAMNSSHLSRTSNAPR